MNGKFAGIPQLGDRNTEDLKVTCSIHVHPKRQQTFSSDTIELNVSQQSYKDDCINVVLMLMILVLLHKNVVMHKNESLKQKMFLSC